MPPLADYSKMWWEDMPQKAQLAAIKMGYTAQLWDEDASIPYDQKKFHETKKDERLAAMYLGLNPIAAKLDIWWEEVDKETQGYAIDIGWDNKKWDDDWELHDLPAEELYWNDLSDKQRKAATYFGYCKYTWDGEGDDSELNFKQVSRCLTNIILLSLVSNRKL